MASSLRFRNGSNKPIKLILEPWAEQYRVDAGLVVEVVAEKETDSIIEFEYDGEDIIIYGWSDSMSVLLAGQKLEPNFE